jgi:two-component system, OmpR family, sensor kinase
MRIPIRLRVTLSFAAGMAVVLAALSMFVFLRTADDLLSVVDLDLQGRAQAIVDAMPDPGIVPSAPGRLVDTDEAFAQVVAPDGTVLASSLRSARSVVPRRALDPLLVPEFITRRLPMFDDAARLFVVRAGTRTSTRYLVVGTTLGDRTDALAKLRLSFVVGGPIALLLVSLAGWLVAGAALRPVERMRREAAAISLSEPSRRLPVPSTSDELARLGATLNSMLDRLHESLQREQRFLDEASHELRTPLSVLRMELDLALSRARSPEELREALRNASQETDRLVRLAEDLLVLSRARNGAIPVHRRDVAIPELLRRAADIGRMRADGKRIHVLVECDDELTARVDPDRVRQALDNLVDNAVRHVREGGRVVVSGSRENGSVRLAVRDDGPGFPQEILDRSFSIETTQSANGAGLGLSIVDAIARAHGGTLTLRNGDDGGGLATFDLRA